MPELGFRVAGDGRRGCHRASRTFVRNGNDLPFTCQALRGLVSEDSPILCFFEAWPVPLGGKYPSTNSLCIQTEVYSRRFPFRYTPAIRAEGFMKVRSLVV